MAKSLKNITSRHQGKIGQAATMLGLRPLDVTLHVRAIAHEYLADTDPTVTWYTSEQIASIGRCTDDRFERFATALHRSGFLWCQVQGDRFVYQLDASVLE